MSTRIPFMNCVFDFPGAGGRGERLVFGAPREVVVAEELDAVVPALEAIEAAQRAGRYAAGFVSFDAAVAFDPAFAVRREAGLPLVAFGIFDAPVSEALPAPDAFEIAPWTLDVAREDFVAAVETLREDIRDGAAYQVNYTLRAESSFSGDAFAYYEQLRRSQACDYCAYLDLGEHKILSASPELFFHLRGNTLITRPMKGTSRRGRWPQEDEALRDALFRSEKERAENLMIVDLLRNDLSRISRLHGVNVKKLFEVERYPTVFQMTSTIEAQLREDTRLADIFRAMFPCGSVTGAPKVSAMSRICDLERNARGVYCGAIGLLTPQQTVFNVAIRTVTLEPGGLAICGLGSGITFDSRAAREYEEVLIKSRFLDEVPQPFELLETLLFDGTDFWLLERHLERLARSAKHFGFPLDIERVARALDGWRLSAPAERVRVRLLVGEDGSPRIEAHPIAPAASGDNVVVPLAKKPVSVGNPFLYHKTTQREEYDARAQDFPAAFDVLLWNDRGEVTEFTRGNVVVEIEGRRYTPPLECGLLGGTFREELLEQGAIAERVLSVEEVRAARRVWFVNSVRGWVEVMLDAFDQIGRRD